MIAKLILNKNTLSTDRLFDYNVPLEIEKDIKVGMRVKVPFGKSNKPCEAYVCYLADESEYDNLKDISSIIDKYTYFDNQKLEIIEFMRHRYFCSYISAIKCFVPVGIKAVYTRYFSINASKEDEISLFCKHSVTADKIINCLRAYGTLSEESIKSEVNKKNVTSALNKMAENELLIVSTKETQKIKEAFKTFVELNIDMEDAITYTDIFLKKNAKARARVMEVLCDNRIIELSELLMYANCAKNTVDFLVGLGYARYFEVSDNSSSVVFDDVIHEKKHLTSQQQNAVDTILPSVKNQNKKTFLIHGVTGSGKTEVYLNLIEQTVSMGKDAVFLVPEISLTPQMISLFYSRFGDNVAVLHSKLTLRQRFNEWMRIKNGEVKIVIGARSAIFAPFSNIGLIIIDEEHETTYKSDMSPRYNAVEIARFISRQQNAVLVLASATPSVDSYYKAQTGAFTLIEMQNRVNNATLPEIKICDMRKEIANGNMSIFSTELQKAIEQNLENGEQTILFLNRRGFSGFVSCRSCGYVMKCPNCNVSLTYHKSNSKMICHYCDYKTEVANICPSCSSRHIRFFGIGTEKLVDEIKNKYPKAKVIRMDADTTTGRMSHETILNSFRKGEADILVGTQMITKGLDFHNVTLVGIVAADMSLCVDDFRSGERTFDLITQVAGRAGRSFKNGKAVIQTYNPDDEVILYSANNDYKSFYQNEIKIRQMLKYPPFSEFINFVFSSQNKYEAFKKANEFYNELTKELKNSVFDASLFKPCECPLFKINQKYRYHFLIKTPYKKDIYNIINKVYQKHSAANSGVCVTVDVNPTTL